MKKLVRFTFLALLFILLLPGCQTTETITVPEFVYVNSTLDISASNKMVFNTKPEDATYTENLLKIIDQLEELDESNPRYSQLLVDFAKVYKELGDEYRNYSVRLEAYILKITDILLEGEKTNDTY